MNPEPTNCQICDASLDNGYCYQYEGDKIVRATCHKCDRKETFELYKKDKRLTSRLMMDNMMKMYDVDRDLYYAKDESVFEKLRVGANEDFNHRIDIALSGHRINKLIKEFESEVWFKGVQDMVLGTRERGVSAHLKTHDNFRVLTYTMAGRTMITIEDDHNQVTCVADETSKESRTGFQSANGTESQCLALLRLAVDLYKNKTLVFDIDKKVSMGF